MFKKKRKPFFADKSCDVCGKRASIFRIIKEKTYMLCSGRKCDFIIRVRHGWATPIIKR